MFAATKISTIDDAKAWLDKKVNATIRPYSWWNHPFMGWIDTIYCFVFPFIWPLCSAVKYLPTGDEKKEAIAYNQTMREKGTKVTNMMFNSSGSPFRKWQKLAGCLIAEVDYHVPRVVNLLKEWGITASVPTENCSPKGDIKVKLFFPTSFLGTIYGDVSADVTSFGTLPVEVKDLSFLPEKVPFVLVFHGGGLVVGDAISSEITELINVVQETTRPLIIASVDYSLSPDYCFPVAIEECLAVADHFLSPSSGSGLKHETIHIGGASAGGYLATIVTMELIRRHPGKVESSCVFAPMMNPAGDSMSYYMNERTSYITPNWLRWCWQAYLELPPSKDTGATGDDDTSIDALLARGSNRTTWAESKYKTDRNVERLIYPLADLPNELGEPNAPKFLVTTNRADPLYNDGLELVMHLKKALSTNAKNLIYLDDTGSHVFGTLMLNQKAFTIAWAISIFGPDAWI